MAAQFDLHFQLLSPESAVGARVFGFGYKTAVAVKGPQKLINRWVKCLLTPQGSDPMNRAYGTQFYQLLGGNISSEADVTDAVALTVQECNRQVRLAESKLGLPPNERLRNAALVRVSPRDTVGYDFWVNITNVAGEVVTVQLPASSLR